MTSTSEDWFLSEAGIKNSKLDVSHGWTVNHQTIMLKQRGARTELTFIAQRSFTRTPLESLFDVFFHCSQGFLVNLQSEEILSSLGGN